MKVQAAGTPNALFVKRSLPWLIGAGGLLLFLITLSHWVTLQSLGTVARVSGWLWRPELNHPLTFTLLLPFRLLPETWIPLALNFMNALCAALVLVLLARSVALLPQDVGSDKSDWNESALKLLLARNSWLPPILASILCAFQLSFWEHATSASGEMLDLLVFAYVLRCLLEFRLDPNQNWLTRAVFVYAAGMTNDWALVAFFPVFIVGLIRAKTVHGFFQPAFLRRVLLCGLAGYSLYLLSPAIQSLFSYPSVDFWTVLKGHARAQREIVGYFRKPAFAVLAVATLLPLVVLSIRWKSHSVQIADDTRLGVFLTKATGHVLHALFFLGSFWLAFDPTFGPRHLAIGPSMLTYYYLSSLVFGYCAGYFLVFGLKASKAQSPNSVRFCRSLLVKSLNSLIFVLPCLLAWRNLGQIRTTNGTLLQEYARNLYADLPPGASTVLSEQPTDLLLLHAQSSMRHYEKNALLLDAPALSSPAYHLFMARHFQSRWPSGSGQELEGSPNTSQRSESGAPTIAPAAADGRGDLAESDAPNRSKVAADKNLRPPIDVRPGRILDLISTIAAREPLYYLYPGLGPVLELFRPEPEGCLHRLRFRPSMGTATTLSAGGGQEFAGTNSSAGKDDANEQFWQRRWSGMLQQLALQTANQSKFPRGLPGTLLRRLRLASEPNATAIAVGTAYSRMLNCWGVQMQRLSRREAAELWFERAVQLNPDNLTARINLEYAQRSRRGDPSRVNVASVQNQFSEVFAKYDNWRQMVATDGPVDEPSFLLRTGRVLLAGGNVRQSIPELARAAELAPDWPAPKLWLAQAYLLSEEFGTALAVSDEIKLPSLPEDGPGLSRLMECRVRALCGLGRTNQAEACIETFVSRFNQNNDVLLAAAELESRNRKFDAGLALLETVLEREPNRAELLSRKGRAQLQLSRYDDAIRSLTAALSLTPRDGDARLCRAIACLGAGQLEAARADYQELLKDATHAANALFGLGTIAWRQQETNTAIQFYQRYVSSRVPDSVQTSLASERLRQLGGGAPGSSSARK